jgi:hypothetical protein
LISGKVNIGQPLVAIDGEDRLPAAGSSGSGLLIASW